LAWFRFGSLDDFARAMTTAQFLLNLLLNIIGSLIGVVVGVWWAKVQWRKDREAQTKVLRANLVKAFRLTLGGIQQALDFLQQSSPIIPNYRLDTATIGHILYSGRSLFSDEALFDRFNWQRYQLDHINAKLDYMHVYLTSNASNQADLTRHEFASLVVHLKTTHKEISELLADYEKVV
jgi:hypothetical protein